MEIAKVAIRTIDDPIMKSTRRPILSIPKPRKGQMIAEIMKGMPNSVAA